MSVIMNARHLNTIANYSTRRMTSKPSRFDFATICFSCSNFFI